MSLKFLSKKSWHTSNLDNVEKVWIAEQNAEKEKKKLSELQKQINEERQIQELRQLQVASGQVVKNVDTSLDWMYEGPAAQSEQSTEEYLLGKIFKPKDNSTNQLKEIGQQPGSLWVNNISQRNDTFTRLHEDPMLLIKKNEKEARENVINNPVKMARIRHQLAAEIDSKKQKKEKKREHKEKEKEKEKEREKKSKERRVSKSRSRSRDRRDQYGDNVRDRDRDDHRGSEKSRRSSSHDRKRRRSRSRSHDRERDRREKYENRNRNRDRSRSRERNRPKSERSWSPKDRGEKRTEVSAGTASRSAKPEYATNERENQSLKGRYGLIRTGNNASAVDDNNQQRRKTGDYGPKQELLAKKREEEEKQENERKLKLEQSRTSGFSNQLSAEEKEKRLKAMMADAEVNDEMRLHRHRPGSKATTAPPVDAPTSVPAPADDDGHEPTAKGIAKGTFLQSLRSEVYTSETTASNGMEDRMRRNRHYYQKGLDLESEGFMKKE